MDRPNFGVQNADLVVDTFSTGGLVNTCVWKDLESLLAVTPAPLPPERGDNVRIGSGA